MTGDEGKLPASELVLYRGQVAHGHDELERPPPTQTGRGDRQKGKDA